MAGSRSVIRGGHGIEVVGGVAIDHSKPMMWQVITTLGILYLRH
jgi:hypothetical protein